MESVDNTIMRRTAETPSNFSKDNAWNMTEEELIRTTNTENN